MHEIGMLSKQSSTESLPCLVIHTPTDQIFPVEVGHDRVLWGKVKDAIKEKKQPEFNDIAADTLTVNGF